MSKIMSKIINFACTGNRGRSEPSRLIAQADLRNRGLLGEYGVISSGTSVDDIKAGNISTAFMIRAIDRLVDLQ